MRAVLCMAVAVPVLAIVAAAGAMTPPPPPRVTVIGDSVLDAVQSNRGPRSILKQGFDVDLEIGICRRLTGMSCPFQDTEVPTLIDLVRELGPRIGPTVLVEVGYNDDAATFAQSVEEAITAVLGAGATHILWVNMHESQQQYIGMNQVLVAAARRHSEVTIVDWNAYSHDQISWFQDDGIHLFYDGAVGMATLLHAALMDALAAPLVVASAHLPVAHLGQPYSARLLARGGTAPYSWQLTSGPLPSGLRLLADGHITGTPRHNARLRLVVRATDASARTASASTTLVVDDS
jgi:hypothetical protein